MHEITIALKEEVISLEKNTMSIRDDLEGRKEREIMQLQSQKIKEVFKTGVEGNTKIEKSIFKHRMNHNVVMADRKQQAYRLSQDKSDERGKEVQLSLKLLPTYREP